jgi:hypothetical protein
MIGGAGANGADVVNLHFALSLTVQSPPMKPLDSLADEIDKDRLERARRMTGEEKFLDGILLFAMAEEFMKAGIREEFPNATETEIITIARSRQSESDD